MLKIKRFLKYSKCIKCGKEFLTYKMIGINNKENICARCGSLKDYRTKNTVTKGKITQMSFSFEFETSSNSEELYELAKYDFEGCFDGSISGKEWKSPIFYNRKSFHAICRKLDKFKQYVGNDCGTHLHVGTKYKGKIREYEYEIFEPILNEMRENKKITKKFWGRYFGHYCQSQICTDRYNSFNTRSSVDTLEFRLLKYINAEQYIRAADFCIDMTRFINYYASKDNFDIYYARKVGEIILKKYKEVTQNVQTDIDE